ncbi:MAG TPA: ABC transporter ATP-binding protein [Actinobacteria bacterium]|nr:ABC transporter ATP-binding protein [Actinomycetota bacterium]
MTPTTAPVSLVGVRHRYGRGPWVLDGVDLTVESGEAVAVMGPSGSGKTTLLSILGLLTAPTDGEVLVAGEPAGTRRRGRLRAEWFTWVFQTVNVLGHRSALDNAALGLLARGVPRPVASRRAREALAAVGLASRADAPVVELSGGELQRVCIARATAAAPRVILADEPTGQLDHATSLTVLDALWAARRPETALVVATHDPEVAGRCDRVLGLVDGRLTERTTP